MRNFLQPVITFNPYDPGTPCVTPDVSTPARATAVQVEDGIRRDVLETGVFIAPDGQVLLRRQGLADRVGFAETELLAIRGSTFTHNHPGGVAFSIEDFALAHRSGLAEIRAVTAHFRHIVVMGSLQPAPVALKRLALDAAPGLSRKVDELVRHDQLHPAHIGVELQHQFWLLVAARFGLNYTRERS